MQYDSGLDVTLHIAEVRRNIALAVGELERRGEVHDKSKFESDEKEQLDVNIPALKGTSYGSPEYLRAKEGLKAFLSIHHARNSHHPEHYPTGISGMDLFDILEMVCDWMSANAADKQVSLDTALGININRFGIESQLASILQNTVRRWPEGS